MSAPQTNDPWVVFDYEVKALFDLLPLLETGNPVYASLPPPVQNAVVESALLHTRQLVDILLSRGQGTDDINLGDLLPGFQPTQIGKLRSEYGQGNLPGDPYWTLNKKLAHPTKHRGDSHDYSDLLMKLTPLLGNIIQEVLSQRRSAPSP